VQDVYARYKEVATEVDIAKLTQEEDNKVTTNSDTALNLF
jgi:hypothetical protein